MVMQKRPEDPSGGETKWNRDEIESHSSNLTNQRIFNIQELVWNAGFDAMSHPGTDPVDFALAVFDYFSITFMLYMNTVPMYLSGKNEKIGKVLMGLSVKGNGLKRSIRSRRFADSDFRTDVEDLLETATQMHYLMTLGMQNLKYLFRIGAQEPRGLDEHLALFAKSALWRKNTKEVETLGQVERIPEKHEG